MNSRSIAWLVGSICAAVVVVAAVVCVRLFVLVPYRLPTASMAPTIPRGAVVWGYKLAYAVPGDVRRTDLVFYRATQPDGSVEIYLKRVIGIPGDRIRTSGHQVFVNDVSLAQTHLREEGSLSVYEEVQDGSRHLITLQLSSRPAVTPPEVELTVPPDSFFVLGDNRMNSLDSRYTGCVRWSDILGRVIGLPTQE